MFGEDELLPLSGLQHLIYCERRAALVHVEGEWAENKYTIEGLHLHRRADDEAPRLESRGDVRIARGVALRSFRLGLVGKADVIEFHRSVTAHGDVWGPFPVEYKRSAMKREQAYEIQLCAQALCLEEMLEVRIPAGALYYGASRRRLDVAFSDVLREETETAARRLHAIIRSQVTPPPEPGPKCRKCSLLEHCMPYGTSDPGSARAYLDRLLTGIEPG